MARSLEATSDRFHNAAGKPKNIPVLFILEEGVLLLQALFEVSTPGGGVEPQLARHGVQVQRDQVH